MFLDRVTADVIQALGTAYLVPDGDCLYIISHESDWLICVTAFTRAFPDEVLFLIDSYTDTRERKYLQWDILCAEIYPERRQYLPGKSKTVKALVAERHPRGIGAEHIRENITERGWALSDTGLDLTALFHQGYARPVYPNEGNESRKGQLARDQAQAQQYNFQYSGRVVAADGAYFRAFYEMGFRIWAPTSRRASLEKISHPVIAAALDDGGTYAFGFMPPVERSGITTSPDGRPIYGDAALVSWASPEEATTLIAMDEEIWSPEAHSLTTLELTAEERLDAVGPRPSYGADVVQTTLFAVGVLRWNGIDEVHIHALLEAQRMPSYQAGYDKALGAVEEGLRLAAGTPAPWQQNQASEIAKKARKVLSSLAALGVGAQEGQLPELEAVLRARAAG